MAIRVVTDEVHLSILQDTGVPDQVEKAIREFLKKELGGRIRFEDQEALQGALGKWRNFLTTYLNDPKRRHNRQARIPTTWYGSRLLLTTGNEVALYVGRRWSRSYDDLIFPVAEVLGLPERAPEPVRPRQRTFAFAASR